MPRRRRLTTKKKEKYSVAKKRKLCFSCPLSLFYLLKFCLLTRPNERRKTEAAYPIIWKKMDNYFCPRGNSAHNFFWADEGQLEDDTVRFLRRREETVLLQKGSPEQKKTLLYFAHKSRCFHYAPSVSRISCWRENEKTPGAWQDRCYHPNWLVTLFLSRSLLSIFQENYDVMWSSDFRWQQRE